jgi:hypothetical protein
MFFFRKKSRNFSLTDLLGFDFKKIDFDTLFPFESYSTTSLAVSTDPMDTPKVLLLNDNQGSKNLIFDSLLRGKQAELQHAIEGLNSLVRVDAAWAKDSAGDDFIHVNAASPMSDVLDAVFQSHVRQRRPVLVNLERSALLSEKPSRLSALVVRDALFHINFLSLTGHHGQLAKRTAFRLLHAGRVAYLGFKMDEFRVLARDKYADLDEEVVKLLADQSKRRMKALTTLDFMGE